MAKKYNKTNQNKTPKVSTANDQLGENMTEFSQEMNPNNKKKNNMNKNQNQDMNEDLDSSSSS